MELGAKIASYRKSRNMTQDELARQFGISNQAVSKWETGQSYPDVELLPMIADYFEISLDELFGREFIQKTEVQESVAFTVPEIRLPEEIKENGRAENYFTDGAENELAYRELLPRAWEDDTTLRAVLFQGRNIVKEAELKTRFGTICTKLHFTYNGPALNVKSIFSVNCGDVQGNVTAGSYVECDDVQGNVSAQNYVECDDVGQSVTSNNYVECADVGDSVTAAGYVECADVGDSVTAAGYVECDDVGGNVSVTAGGYVECGDVGGNVVAEGNVECGDVGGSVSAGGKVN